MISHFSLRGIGVAGGLGNVWAIIFNGSFLLYKACLKKSDYSQCSVTGLGCCGRGIVWSPGLGQKGLSARCSVERLYLGRYEYREAVGSLGDAAMLISQRNPRNNPS